MTKLYAEIIKKCRWKFVCKETVKKQVNHAKIANERDRQTDRQTETKTGTETDRQTEMNVMTTQLMKSEWSSQSQ